MTGEKKGVTYFLKEKRAIMGRSEKADIQIFDVKASREHIELARVGNTYVLTDLKSQNGVMVNDLKVTQYTLKEGDKIIIGHTVYKFNDLKIDDVAK
ncbi:MAG: FHA domain-containing protein, partial [Pseudomonadota bacterium]